MEHYEHERTDYIRQFRWLSFWNAFRIENQTLSLTRNRLELLHRATASASALGVESHRPGQVEFGGNVMTRHCCWMSLVVPKNGLLSIVGSIWSLVSC